MRHFTAAKVKLLKSPSRAGGFPSQITRVGISANSERATRLERIKEFLPLKSVERLPDCNCFLEPARAILQRQMEYEGVIPEGASYSVTPLAVILLQKMSIHE